MIVNLIKINIIDKFLKRTFINKISINDFFQITKNAFNNDIISFNKIENVSKDY